MGPSPRVAAAVAAFAAAAFAPVAFAAGNPGTSEYGATPPPSAAPAGSVGGIGEYMETTPGAGGARAIGASVPQRLTHLSPRAQTAVQADGGADTSLLSELATSAYYGAPQLRLRYAPNRMSGPPIRTTGSPSLGTAAATVAADAFTSGGGRVVGIWVVALLLGIGALALGLRGPRRLGAAAR